MRLGMVVGGSLAGIASFARGVEEAGFDSVWTAETSSSAFVTAMLAAQGTDRVRVGTAIALAFPRSPAVAAMNAVDLDEVAGGRFTLGLGSQVKRVNEQRFSVPFEHPAPKMREYVLAVRAFIAGYFGTPPEFRGRFYSITMPPWPRVSPPVRREIPIHLAGVNVNMLRAAGEVADGVIGHPMTSRKYIEEVVRPEIARGARRAGRDPSAVELAQGAIIAISNDPREAEREARQQVGFYATTRTYTPVLALHGFDDVVPALRDAYDARDMDLLASLVPDEMVQTFSVFGTPDEVREKVGRFEGVVDELMLGGPWYRVDPARLVENHRLILETFAR